MPQHPKFEAYALLVADMVGYSQWLARHPLVLRETFSTHLHSVFHPTIRKRRGRLVKTTGDGVIAIFKNPRDAESCARDVQSQIERQSPATEAALPVKYRISLHCGDIIVEPSDIYGIDVNTAIHMQALAPPGGICASGNYFRSLKTDAKHSYHYVGMKYLKNIPDPIDLYFLITQTMLSEDIFHAPPLRRSFLRPPPRVGLAEFQTYADSDLHTMIGEMAHEALIRGLSRFRDLLSVSSIRIPVKANPADASRQRQSLSKELGLSFLIYGSCMILNQKIVMSVHLDDLLRNELLWSTKLDADVAKFEHFEHIVMDNAVAPVALYVQRATQAAWQDTGSSESEASFKEAQRFIAQGTLASIAQARILLSRILDRCGEIADVHIAAARAEHLYGRLLAGQEFIDSLERARAHATLAIEIDDLSPQAHAELALQEMFLKRHEVAADVYQRALRLNPYDPMLHADWADCLVWMGRATEALPILERVAAGWPRDRSWVEWNLCDAEWALNRPERVIEMMRNKPDQPHVHRFLAASYAKLGRIAEARHHAEMVRQHQPQFSTKQWSKVTPYTKSDSSEEYADYLARAGL